MFYFFSLQIFSFPYWLLLWIYFFQPFIHNLWLKQQKSQPLVVTTCQQMSIKIFFLWKSPLIHFGEGNVNPLQYSCLENPTDRGEPGGLQSMESQRVGHDWANFTHSYPTVGFAGSSAGKISAWNAQDPSSFLSQEDPLEKGHYWLQFSWTSLVALTVKNLPAMWETWVWSLGMEDPLEEGMATHSRILAWRIRMDRGAWRATVHVVAKSCTPLSD